MSDGAEGQLGKVTVLGMVVGMVTQHVSSWCHWTGHLKWLRGEVSCYVYFSTFLKKMCFWYIPSSAFSALSPMFPSAPTLSCRFFADLLSGKALALTHTEVGAQDGQGHFYLSRTENGE